MLGTTPQDNYKNKRPELATPKGSAPGMWRGRVAERADLVTVHSRRISFALTIRQPIVLLRVVVCAVMPGCGDPAERKATNGSLPLAFLDCLLECPVSPVPGSATFCEVLAWQWSPHEQLAFDLPHFGLQPKSMTLLKRAQGL